MNIGICIYDELKLLDLKIENKIKFVEEYAEKANVLELLMQIILMISDSIS